MGTYATACAAAVGGRPRRRRLGDGRRAEASQQGQGRERPPSTGLSRRRATPRDAQGGRRRPLRATVPSQRRRYRSLPRACSPAFATMRVPMKLTLLAAVAAMPLLGGCGHGGPDGAAPGPAPRPQLSTGRDVTVRGPVTQVLSGHVVTIGGAGQDPLVVVFRQPTAVTLGRVLEVTGRVRTFRAAELEAEVGTDLAAAVGRFEGATYLLVSSVGG